MPTKRVVQSFRNAVSGLSRVFRSEHNFRIQLLCAAGALLGIAVFPLERFEIMLILLVTALVLIMEIINSAVEYMSDLVKPRLHNYVHNVKDIMAGAVLLMSIAAAALGAYIFYPYFMDWFRYGILKAG